MTIVVNVELEQAGENGPVVWWAKVPAIPGLRVAAASLRELEFLAREAVRDALAEQGVTEPAELSLTLIDDTERSAGDEPVAVRTDPQGAQNVGAAGRRTTAEPALVA